jgi:hypothetical protein
LVIQTLTSEQKEILQEYGKEIESWRTTRKGQKKIQLHRDHEKYFKNMLSPENLDRMEAQEFAEFYSELWASNVWQNKNWAIENKLIAPNGLKKIKEELKKLLYGTGSIIERYNNFKNNIKGFGPSSISEILHFVFPEKYCLWNEKPKTVLPIVHLDILPDRFFNSQLTSGQDYFDCISALDLIKNEVAQYGIKDFIDLDVMFWNIFDDVLPTLQKKPKRHKILKKLEMVKKKYVTKIDTHQSAQYHLLQLGNMLGYLTFTPDSLKRYNGQKLGDVATLKEIPAFTGERDLNSAKKIDVIWFGEDENPRMCFEVEHSTGISPGLNRLLQLQHLRVRFFIVSSEDQRGKFESEMKKFPYRTLRDSYRFISYDELGQLYETTVPFHQMKMKLIGEDLIPSND